MQTETTACLLAPRCKNKALGRCEPGKCFPFRKLCALQNAAGIPEAYRGATVDNPDFLNGNPRAYAFIKGFVNDIEAHISTGDGLFIFSKSSRENVRGTGTGKTSAGCAALNAHLMNVVVKQCATGDVFDGLPGLFVNASTYQNTYNEQFRGSEEAQAAASAVYYDLKKAMDTVPLLVLDDLGVRGATEAFRAEMYEIIDLRTAGHRATIITSNMALDGIATVLDERISSRISAACQVVQFTGRDHRATMKGGAVVC
jgi:DNA replication protein DnaC